MSERTIPMIRTREKRDGKWHAIERTDDPKIHITIDLGPDDQRPEPDGKFFFEPFLVEDRYDYGGESRVSGYLDYCGSCFKLIENMYRGHKFCYNCGAGIAHRSSRHSLIFTRKKWNDFDKPKDLRDTGLLSHLIEAANVYDDRGLSCL